MFGEREQSLLAILSNPNTVAKPSAQPILPISSFSSLSNGASRISGSQIRFEMDSRTPSNIPLDSQAITLVPSKLEYKLGASIAVCPEFICYAVRGGKIRVIGQAQGEMALIRDHTQSILDLQITTSQESKKSLLASVSLDDTIRVFDLSIQDEITPQIIPQLLLTIHGYKATNDAAPSFTLSKWSSSNVLAIAGLNEILLIDIELTAQETSGDADLSENIVGIEKISLEKVITALAFSPDGQVLVVSTSTGELIAYSVSSKQCLCEWNPFSNTSSIDSIYFIDECSLVIGSNRNTSLLIFNIATGKVYQSFEFRTSIQDKPLFNIIHHDEQGHLILIGNSTRASLYSLHYELPSFTQESISLEQIILQKHQIYESGPSFDFVIEFPLGDEILSMVSMSEYESSQRTVVYCVQTKTVQKFLFESKLGNPVNKMAYPIVSDTVTDTIPTNIPLSLGTPLENKKDQVQQITSQKSGVELLELLMQGTNIIEQDQNVFEKNVEEKVKPVSVCKPKQTPPPSSLKETRSKEPPKEILRRITPIENPKQETTKDVKEVKEVKEKDKTKESSSQDNLLKEFKELEKRLNEKIDKISKNESNLKETLDKEVKSLTKKISNDNTQFLNSLANSLSTTATQTLEKVVREAFEKSLIVKLEKAVSAMLLQIHETVDSGMKELSRNVQSNSIEWKNSIEKIQKSLDKLESTSSLSNANANTNTSNAIMSSKSVLESYFTSKEWQSLLSNAVSTEIRQAMSQLSPLDSASASRRWSQLPPPVESKELELKQEIDLDLESKQYEKAFTAALGSSDLSIVLHICQKVDPKVVFNSVKLLVSQPIILSLMHQISLDLSKNTGMKLTWLQECVMNINKADPVVTEHVPRILAIVHRRLEEWVKRVSVEEPAHSHLRTGKMLMMMTASLV